MLNHTYHVVLDRPAPFKRKDLFVGTDRAWAVQRYNHAAVFSLDDGEHDLSSGNHTVSLVVYDSEGKAVGSRTAKFNSDCTLYETCLGTEGDYSGPFDERRAERGFTSWFLVLDPLEPTNALVFEALVGEEAKAKACDHWDYNAEEREEAMREMVVVRLDEDQAKDLKLVQ